MCSDILIVRASSVWTQNRSLRSRLLQLGQFVQNLVSARYDDLSLSRSKYYPSVSFRYLSEEKDPSVGLEVSTAVIMINSILCYVTSCSPLSVNRRFGGTCRLHLQGGRMRQVRNQREADRK
jgi:hypothetical protein